MQWTCTSAEELRLPSFVTGESVDVFELIFRDVTIIVSELYVLLDTSPYWHVPFRRVILDGVNVSSIYTVNAPQPSFAIATTGPASSFSPLPRTNERGWAGLDLTVVNSQLSGMAAFREDLDNASPFFYPIDGNYYFSINVINSNVTGSAFVATGTVVATGQINVTISIDEESSVDGSFFQYLGALVAGQNMGVVVSGKSSTSDSSIDYGELSAVLAAGGSVYSRWSGFLGAIALPQVVGEQYQEWGAWSYESPVATRYATLAAASAIGSLPRAIAGQLALEDLCSGGVAGGMTDASFREMIAIFGDALCSSSNSTALATADAIFADLPIYSDAFGPTTTAWRQMFNSIQTGGSSADAARASFGSYLLDLQSATHGSYSDSFFRQLGLDADEFLQVSARISEAGLGLGRLFFTSSSAELWVRVWQLYDEGFTPRSVAADLLNTTRLAIEVSEATSSASPSSPLGGASQSAILSPGAPVDTASPSSPSSAGAVG